MKKNNKILSKGIIFIFILILQITLFAFFSKTYSASIKLYIDGYEKGNTKTLELNSEGRYASIPNIVINEDMLNYQNNVFCMNRARSFYGLRTCYEQIYFYILNGKVYYTMDGQAVKEYTDTEFENDYNKNNDITNRNFAEDLYDEEFTNLFTNTNKHKLAYILSELETNTSDFGKLNKVNRSSSEYQWAIWLLQADEDIDIVKDSLEENYTLAEKAYKLLAKANAYYNYVNAGYINSKPTINTNSTTLYVASNGNYVMGPITFTFETGEGKYEGQEAIYGEITSLSLQEVNASLKNISLNNVYSNATCTTSSSIKSGQAVYLKLTQSQYNALRTKSEIKIQAGVNNQYRNAYLYLLRCNGSERYTYLEYNSEFLWKETTMEWESSYDYCDTCNGKYQYVTYGNVCASCNKTTFESEPYFEIHCHGCGKTRSTDTYPGSSDDPNNNPCCTGFAFDYLVEHHGGDKECTCTVEGKSLTRWREYLYCPNCKIYKESLNSSNIDLGIKENTTAFSFRFNNEFTEITQAQHYCTPNPENQNEYVGTDMIGNIEKCSSCGGKIVEENNEAYEYIKDLMSQGCIASNSLQMEEEQEYLEQNIFNPINEYQEQENELGYIIVSETKLKCEECGLSVIPKGKDYNYSGGYIGKISKDRSDATSGGRWDIVASDWWESCEGKNICCNSCKYGALVEDINPQLMRLYSYNLISPENSDLFKDLGIILINEEVIPTNIVITEKVTSKVVEGNKQEFQNLIAGGGSASVDYINATFKQNQIEKLTLTKLNAATTIAISDINFNIKIENVLAASIGDTSYSKEQLLEGIKKATGSSGNIVLENIIIDDASKPVTVTIAEYASDTKYYNWYTNPVKLEITKTTTGISIKRISGPDFLPLDNSNISIHGYSYYGGNITTSGNTGIVTVTNIPLISIAGNVYLDGQSGLKGANDPDGIKSSEENGIEGIEISLRDENYEEIKTTITDSSGNYIFEGILAQPYFLQYSYNGMTYESSVNQGVTENRDKFNERFNYFNNEISNDAKTEDDQILLNEYTYISAYTRQIQLYHLNTSWLKDGQPLNVATATSSMLVPSTPAGGLTPMHIVTGEATSITPIQPPTLAENEVIPTISTTDGIITVNHSYGLLQRSADLELGVLVDNIKVTSNGQTSITEYRETQASQDLNTDKQQVYYCELAEIDYNFTMSQYKNIWNLPEEEFVEDEIDPIEIEATYLIKIANNSSRQSKVNYIQLEEGDKLKGLEKTKIKYYYDTKPEKTELTAVLDENNILNLSETTAINGGDTLFLEITYTIPQDSIIIKDGESIEDKKFTIEAEILEYSTDGYTFNNGKYTTQPNMVDIDSTPGNYFNEDENARVIGEDDGGSATVTLIKSEEVERQISGIVFEDKKTVEEKDESGNVNYIHGNGNFDSDEIKLNGVIVQLIELREIEILGTVVTCEYIWQETVTGGNTISRMSYDGTTIEKIQLSEDEIIDGGYIFKDIIPGKYVVRFRYGDENETYNGINYKSTTDNNYNKEWHNNSVYTTEVPSVARDIEARRLELMSKTITEPSSSVEKYMVAETSKINIAQSTNDLSNVSSNISYSGNIVENQFNNINLGIEERPQTEIYLEKHLTGIEIKNGRTTLLQYVDNESTPSENLKVLLGTKENRGNLHFETDTEVLQGASLKMRHTYTIANKGEYDYLSKELIEKYENSTAETYKEYLETLAKGINEKNTNITGEDYNIGKFLGSTYYTGVINKEEVAEVSLKVEEITDYLNNEFKLSAEDGFKMVEVNKIGRKIKEKGENGTILDGENAIVKNAIVSTLATNALGIGETTEKSSIIEKTDKISSTGNLSFVGYNAEVSDYSIPTGRRSSVQSARNINYSYIEDETVRRKTRRG